MRPKATLELSEDERSELQALARRRKTSLNTRAPSLGAAIEKVARET